MATHDVGLGDQSPTLNAIGAHSTIASRVKVSAADLKNQPSRPAAT